MKRNNKKLITTILLSAMLITVIMTASMLRVRAAEAGPVVPRETIVIRADRMLRYWKVPNQDNYWSWIPQMYFSIKGNIGTGSKVLVDFTMPDGKAWYSTTAATENYGNPELTQVAVNDRNGHMDERGTLLTGVFGYKVTVKNALAGTTSTLLTGKFKVGKFHAGLDLPVNKTQFEYYVDQDWRLPIGYLYLNTKASAEAPPLAAGIWFRGNDMDDTKLAAYVFFNGKQIGSTKDAGSAGKAASILTSGSDGDAKWELWNFSWSGVRGYNIDKSGNRYTDTHFLSVNPGTYEIKVLRTGKLARTTSFTVGSDGKIVNDGMAEKNNLSAYLIILPVKVVGDQDGKVNLTSVQTDAYYANPLNGFTLP